MIRCDNDELVIENNVEPRNEEVYRVVVRG